MPAQAVSTRPTQAPPPVPPAPAAEALPANPPLHTNAKSGKKIVNGVTYLSDGFPDSKGIPDVFDYMKLLTAAQWDPNNAPREKVDCYLYRVEPPVPWAKQPNMNAYVDKIFFPVDHEWVSKNFGGGLWRINMKRGYGDDRGDLYNVTFITAGDPKDLSHIEQLRRRARGESEIATPVATSAAASGPLPAATDVLASMERMQQRYLDAEERRRNTFDPLKEAAEISKTQREILARPEPKSDSPSMLQIMEMMDRRAAEVRRETMEMMDRIMKREAPAESKSLVDSLKEAFSVMSLLRGQGGEPIAEIAAAPSFVQTVVEGLPKILSAGGDMIDRYTASQRAAAANGARNITPPAAATAPTQAPPIELPAMDAELAMQFSVEKKIAGRMIETSFPEKDEPYDTQGFDCADLMYRNMPDMAVWLYNHAKNPQRPADVILDPVLERLMTHADSLAFFNDFIRYFAEMEAEAATAETEKSK